MYVKFVYVCIVILVSANVYVVMIVINAQFNLHGCQACE